MRPAFLALIIVLIAPPAGAIYFYTGNEAYEQCRPDAPPVNNTFCIGYVAGLNDQSAISYGSRNCAPVGVQINQLRDLFGNYLRDHPETRHQLAANLFNSAMQEAFPCQ